MSKKLWFILGAIVVVIILFILYSNKPPVHLGSAESFGGNDGVVEMQEASFGLAVSDEALGGRLAPSGNAKMARAEDTTAPGEPDIDVAEDRLIIKTGTLSMVVDDVSESIGKIKNYAKEKGGFVVTSNISKYGVAPTGNITIRIPVEVFDAGFEEVKAFGDVKDQRVDGRDVTEEFVDLDSQLGNLRATEAQFLEIMKKAFKISDVLDVQRELTRVRGQIDGIEGRMKYLRESASMSTLTVHLSTDPSALPVIEDEDRWKPIGVIKDAFRSLIEIGKSFANGIIWLVIYIPLWVVIGLVVWGVMRFFKKKK